MKTLKKYWWAILIVIWLIVTFVLYKKLQNAKDEIQI